MKKKLTKILMPLAFYFTASIHAQVKIGDNPLTIATIQPSTLLEIESSDKALLVTRIANTASITTPVSGMIIYDNSGSCFRAYQGASWSGCNFAADASSGGSAAVSSWNCSGTDTGTMQVGVPVSGVTHTVTANVTSVGSYSVQAIINGVSFSATGTFPGTGSQTITLTASGTPTISGINTYGLSTTPSCSFARTVNP
ncbi:hypothetical protein N0B16_03405 [Chryseobacterium sp. GMJ5]|uniref:Uncharacterized protein n=1 Tax=Chryseobacterium gilvum TaxID=2976534 RepID=A0ABT2VU07_9FLAO|nr:hypothetical protein [Chryseobacterium gilvum]MCU7613473.1 hypothetical protein [Chryseobacterium gilvum]